MSCCSSDRQKDLSNQRRRKRELHARIRFKGTRDFRNSQAVPRVLNVYNASIIAQSQFGSAMTERAITLVRESTKAQAERQLEDLRAAHSKSLEAHVMGLSLTFLYFDFTVTHQ